MNKTACIISVGNYAGHKCLFKGRDRNYVPEIKVYHEKIDGTEVLYLKDELTGWCEGLNEYGIGIVNSALAVVDDENEKDAAKGKSTKATGATLRDGERVRAALAETTVEKAAQTVQTHKKGLRGHTLIADPETTISLESTWRGHDFHQETLSESKIHVRTNHGLYHETAGYTAKDGDNYLSTLARRDQAMKVLNKVEHPEQVAPAIYGHRKPDHKDPLNMVKLTDKMRTTTQMVLDLTDRTAYLYLIPGQVKYLGYVKSEKLTGPKIKFKLYEYTDIDGDGEFDVLERKLTKTDQTGTKTASLDQAWGPIIQKQASDNFLPLMDPLFNLREIAKQMILLEDHLFHEQKQCKDCISKHCLTIEALAEEAVTLDTTGEHRVLCQRLAELARETLEQLLTGETKPEKVAQDIRVIRKQLVDMTSKLKVTASNSDTPTTQGLESLWHDQNLRLAKFKSKKKIKTQDGKDTITVYEYSDRQIATRNKEKAERLEALTKNVSKLESQVSKDMDSKETKTRLTALAVGLMHALFERVGNEESAEDGHFGVTGWLREHVKFSGSKATISYTGKSGVDHTKTVEDSKLVKALKGCCEDKKPDQSILSFGEEDSEGAVKITAADVNEYLKPFDISAKDIRGFGANLTIREELKAERKKGGKLPEDKKERAQKLKDEFKAALERTAEIVGHTPSQCKSAYVTPGTEETYLKDGTIMESMVKKAGDGCGTSETSYAWVDPTGKVYKLYGRTHDSFVAQWSKDHREENPDATPDERFWGKGVSLLDDGWVRVSNLYNLESKRLGKPQAAYASVAEMLSACVSKNPKGLDQIVRIQVWAGSTNKQLSVDQFVTEFGGRQMADQMYAKLMQTKTASSYTEDTCPVCQQNATGSCRCFIGDRTCPSGHEWVVCPTDGNRLIVPEGMNTHDIGIQPHACLCSKFTVLKTASSYVCDPGDTSFAWIDPSGKVHKLLGRTHATFEEQWAKDHNWPSFDEQMETGNFTTLLGGGWLRVSNAYNIEGDRLGVPAAAWEAAAELLADCVGDSGQISQRVYVEIKYGSNPTYKAEEFVKQFGGRRMVEKMFEQISKTASQNALEALYGPCLFSRTATLSQGEKEDRAVDNLIKPSPDKKPPRDDLRNRRIDTDPDPDLNPKQDKDLSKNYKDV